MNAEKYFSKRRWERPENNILEIKSEQFSFQSLKRKKRNQLHIICNGVAFYCTNCRMNETIDDSTYADNHKTRQETKIIIVELWAHSNYSMNRKIVFIINFNFCLCEWRCFSLILFSFLSPMFVLLNSLLFPQFNYFDLF